MRQKSKRRNYSGTVHFRLDPNIKEKLEQQADALGISLSAYMRLTLEQNAATPLKLNRVRVKEAM